MRRFRMTGAAMAPISSTSLTVGTLIITSPTLAAVTRPVRSRRHLALLNLPDHPQRPASPGLRRKRPDPQSRNATRDERDAPATGVGRLDVVDLLPVWRPATTVVRVRVSVRRVPGLLLIAGVGRYPRARVPRLSLRLEIAAPCRIAVDGHLHVLHRPSLEPQLTPHALVVVWSLPSLRQAVIDV